LKIKEIREWLKTKTGIDKDSFMNAMILFKMSQVAANMRANVVLGDKTKVPINVYCLALAKSGFSKGLTMNLLEDNIFSSFKERFMKYTAPSVFEKSVQKHAEEIMIRMSVDEQTAKDMIYEELRKIPSYLYSYSECTVEGTKAMRRRLHLSGIGALNFKIDEIGLNLDRLADVFAIYLEMYDMAKADNKLIKTESNKDADGIPVNMLMFGTPNSLFDGSKLEQTFFAKLREGYGRRLLYSYVEPHITAKVLTPQEKYALMKNNEVKASEMALNDYFKSFADEDFLNVSLEFSNEAEMKYLEYQFEKTKEAEELSEFEDLRKIELNHRYWKVIKISGLLAFIEKRSQVDIECIDEAINIVELSGKDFNKMLNRPANYVRLAEYITTIGKELTQHDLVENLGFFSGAKQSKEEMLSLAISYAYSKGRIIKRKFVDGIEIIEGETLKPTNLNQIICSYSTHITENYEDKLAKFDDLYSLVTCAGYHYAAHHFKDGYRNNQNAKPRFNLIILDVDNGISIECVKNIFEEYTYLLATTKSHNKNKGGTVCERFRVIMPMKYELSLNSETYSKFMKNVFEWCPFEVDYATSDAARKYESYEGAYFYNYGSNIDPLQFIPDTKKAEERQQRFSKYNGSGSLERWFLLNMSQGNRNNLLARFSFALVDNGFGYEDIEDRVMELNKQLEEPLEVEEVMKTVMKTVKRKIHEGE